jgi:maltooligosyltrehalose synthase
MAGVEKPPVGKAVWKDTKVELPARLGTGFQNVFTGVSGVATREGGKFFLPLAEGMSDFPIALLEFSRT